MSKDYLSNLDGLFDYQIESAEHVLNVLRKRKRAIIGHDMGVGKTYETIALVRELDLPTLVVAPKSSLDKWERVGEQMGGEVTAINYERLTRCKTPFGRFGPDEQGITRWHWDDAVQFIVFDECHRCGGTTTSNHKLMVAARQDDRMSVALSATAAETPMRMKALGYYLNLFGDDSLKERLVRTKKGIRRKLYRSRAVGAPFREWCLKHGCHDGWEGFDFYGKPEEKAEHMRRLHNEIYPAHGSRIKVEDIPGFPETQITAELIDMGESSKMNRLYKEMEKELDALAERTADWNTEMGCLEQCEERQRVDLLKVPTYVELANDAIAEGRSVALFVPYRATVEAIFQRLDVPTSRIWGGQSSKQRAEEIEKFSLDKTRVCIIVNQAGGESIDLHDIRGEFPRVSYITPPYEAWLLRQIVGRVRRAGGKSKSLQRILCAKGTCEENVFYNLMEKELCMDALNDGDLTPFKYKLAA